MAEPARAGIGGVRLYRRMVGAEMRSTMEYPVSFAVAVLTNVGWLALDLVAVLAVFATSTLSPGGRWVTPSCSTAWLRPASTWPT